MPGGGRVAVQQIIHSVSPVIEWMILHVLKLYGYVKPRVCLQYVCML